MIIYNKNQMEKKMIAEQLINKNYSLGQDNRNDKPKKETECVICEESIPDYTPDYCCSGFECGCMGLPTEPPVCS